MFGLCIFFISTYLGIHTVFSDGKSGAWGKLQNLPTAGLTQNGSWLRGHCGSCQLCCRTLSLWLCGVLQQSLRILSNSESNHVHTWEQRSGAHWTPTPTLQAFIISLTERFHVVLRKSYLSFEWNSAATLSAGPPLFSRASTLSALGQRSLRWPRSKDKPQNTGYHDYCSPLLMSR